MGCSLSSLRPPDRDVPGLRSRHGAPHVDQVLLGVDLDDLQVLGGHPLAAHPAGHPHAREDSGRIGRRADRTRRAVEHRAVRAAAASEVVALHGALKALALAGADDVHVVLLVEHRGLDLVPGLELLAGVETEFLQLADRRHAGLLEVAGLWLIRLRRLLLDEADLHRLIAIDVGRLALYHQAGAGLDHRHRDHRPVLDVDLRHPHLASQDSFHGVPLLAIPGGYLPNALISTSTPAGSSSFISASTVWLVGSKMSSSRLCVRISNCSRDFLSTCGERFTVYREM